MDRFTLAQVLKDKTILNNSELVLVPNLFSSIVSNTKLTKFIKRKISLGDAGSPQFFSQLLG